MSLQNIKSLGFGGAGIPTELPKAVAELQGLTISGPLTGVGSGTAIAVSGIESGMVVLKALLFTAGVPSDITGNVTIIDRRASATITLSGVVAGDTVSVNGKTYTFVVDWGFAGNPLPFQVKVGTTDALSATALAAAIMSGDSTVFASALSNVVTVFNRAEGTVGNGKVLSASGSNGHMTVSGNTANGNDTQGITINTSTSGNLVLLFWYNKTAVAIVPSMPSPPYA